MKADSVDQISRKFDYMLRTDLRVLDQLISSDLYAMIEKDRKTIQRLAQDDLDDVNMFRDKNSKFKMEVQLKQHESSVCVDQAIEDIFYLDSMDVHAKEKIQILGFQALKTADGDVIPFKKIGNANPEIEKDQAHLRKQLTHSLKSKVNPAIDLNKKFDIQTFENAMKNPR